MAPKLLDTALWNAGLFTNKMFGTSEATSHSGVTRLWMYELYAKSIEEDHKKRGINQPEKPVVVATAQITPKKAIPARRRRAVVKLKPNKLYKPLPHYAPVFVKPVNTPGIAEYLAQLAPLPRLSLISNAKITKTIEKTPTSTSARPTRSSKKKREEEYLLLMVA